MVASSTQKPHLPCLFFGDREVCVGHCVGADKEMPNICRDVEFWYKALTTISSDSCDDDLALRQGRRRLFNRRSSLSVCVGDKVDNCGSSSASGEGVHSPSSTKSSSSSGRLSISSDYSSGTSSLSSFSPPTSLPVTRSSPLTTTRLHSWVEAPEFVPATVAVPSKPFGNGYRKVWNGPNEDYQLKELKRRNGPDMEKRFMFNFDEYYLNNHHAQDDSGYWHMASASPSPSSSSGALPSSGPITPNHDMNSFCSDGVLPLDLAKFRHEKVAGDILEYGNGDIRRPFRWPLKAATEKRHYQHPLRRRSCTYCLRKGMNESMYDSHCLRNPLTKKIMCPQLKEKLCPTCPDTGNDDVHSSDECPLRGHH